MLSSRKGKIGELLVILDLLQRGHIIIAKNFKLGHNEIDIISKNNDRLYLFEVRLRRIHHESNTTYSSTQWISNRKLFLFKKASYQLQTDSKAKNKLGKYIKGYMTVLSRLAIVHYTQKATLSHYRIEYVPV